MEGQAMRKFVATAAVAASAAATIALTPLAAHANPPGAEIRTGCVNGITGYYVDPDTSVHSFELVPGTSWPIDAGTTATGVYSFFINQPAALESYGPSLDNDRGFEFETQRVEKAVVNMHTGAQHVYFNDKANGFSFNAPIGSDTFSIFYQCGSGRS
jgi:hypothetical protein